MMPWHSTHRSLLALCDPLGPRMASNAAPPRAATLKALLELADRHGVLPAVMANLRSLSAQRGDQWPAQNGNGQDGDAPLPLEAASRRLMQRTALVLALRGQVRGIMAAMGQASLPVVVLKGADFADRLYPHPSLRPFGDVDLLIPHRTLGSTRDIMAGLGYRPLVADMKHAGGYGEESWRREGPIGGTVEVHWNLVNSPSLQRSISVTYEDLQLESHQELCYPSAAGALLIAAVHGAASHAFDRIQGLCDVTQAVRGAAGELDEDWLAQAIARTGSGLAIATALSLAGKIMCEPRCRQLLVRLGLGASACLGSLTITRGVVLRAHARRDSFRRQLFREFLKIK